MGEDITTLISEGLGSSRPDFGNILDPVMVTIRNHSVPVLLMAVGIRWLVYKLVREQAEPALHAEDHGRGIQTPQ